MGKDKEKEAPQWWVQTEGTVQETSIEDLVLGIQSGRWPKTVQVKHGDSKWGQARHFKQIRSALSSAKFERFFESLSPGTFLFLVAFVVLASRLVLGEWRILPILLLSSYGLMAVQYLGDLTPWPVPTFTLLVISLLLWLKVFGSYGFLWDLLAILSGTLAMYLLGRLLRRIDGGRWKGAAIPLGLLIIWCFGSLFDVMTQHHPIPSDPQRFVSSDPEPTPAIGLALSGGGYRAALFHAGVLHQLDTMGVRIQAISAVSGGAIIGSFYATGGKPRDFLEAVVDGRFNLKRDLAGVHNALRLPLPIPLRFYLPGTLQVVDLDRDFNRSTVQASLLDRVLFKGLQLSDLPLAGGPELLLGTTDLNRGLAVGLMPSGLLLNSSRGGRFIGDEGETPVSPMSLAEGVTLSGSFPGAFPVTPMRIPIEPVSKLHRSTTLDLSLVDGGVLDNLGLGLLLEARKRAIPSSAPSAPGMSQWLRDFVRKDRGQTSATWNLETILVSDGGALFDRAIVKTGKLESLSRVIDVLSAQTLLNAHNALAEAGLPSLFFRAADLAPPPSADLEGRSLLQLSQERADFSCPVDLEDLGDLQLVQRLAEFAPYKYFLEDHAEAKALEPLVEALRNSWIFMVEPKDLSAKERYFLAQGIELQKRVCDDLWSTFETFRHTPTLQDQFRSGQAEAIYRLGRYMVLFQSRELQGLLAQAEREDAKPASTP